MFEVPSKERFMKKAFAAVSDSYDVNQMDKLDLIFFGMYAFTHGGCISSNEKLDDCLLYTLSENLPHSEERINRAKCYGRRTVEIYSHLSEEERIIWHERLKTYDEGLRVSDVPDKYIYIDAICVRRELREAGRAYRLIEYLKSKGRDIISFSCDDEKKAFFEKLGFEELATANFDEYGISRKYMIWRCNGKEGKAY